MTDWGEMEAHWTMWALFPKDDVTDEGVPKGLDVSPEDWGACSTMGSSFLRERKLNKSSNRVTEKTHGGGSCSGNGDDDAGDCERDSIPAPSSSSPVFCRLESSG